MTEGMNSSGSFQGNSDGQRSTQGKTSPRSEGANVLAAALVLCVFFLCVTAVILAAIL